MSWIYANGGKGGAVGCILSGYAGWAYLGQNCGPGVNIDRVICGNNARSAWVSG